MSRFITAVLAGVAAAGLAVSAQASLSYGYTVEYKTNPAPGERVPVAVYLQEVATGGDSSRLQSAEGLFSAGFAFEVQSDLPSDPAVIASSADVIPGPGFNDPLPVVTWTPSRVTVWEFRDFAATTGVLPVDLGNGVRRVFLGTVIVTAGAVPGNKAHFQVTDRDPTMSDTMPWDFDPEATTPIAYDDNPNNPIREVAFAATAMVVTVPEPVTSGLALLGLGAVGLRVGRRRR